MATILKFPAHAPVKRRAEPRTGETARIIMFTGVRYERLDDDVSKGSGGGRPRKRRSRA